MYGLKPTFDCPTRRAVEWLEMAGKRPLAGQELSLSDLSLLGHFKRVVYLYPEVSHCTFKLRMAQEQLNRAQILGASIDQRCLGATHRVSPVRRVIQTNRCNPTMNDASILACRHVR
ncbi:hypothetical protein B0G84_5769 [Paraburkholderia sp. BL8N3]|nr:hypothetical protein B0G84_5769 [Paraburkholderia sp. BL8N3]